MKLTWKNQDKNKKKRPLSFTFAFGPDEDLSLPAATVIEERFTIDKTTQPTTDQEDDQVHRSWNLDVSEVTQLAESFQAQGTTLAEDRRYREALGKWEAALTLMPDRAAIHEQKAQVLLEIGETWKSLKAATRATELEPSWAEAWITLGRAQLNFGEPDSAVESFDKALAIKPDSVDAQDDRQTALHLVRKRKQLHTSGLGADKSRYVVGDKPTSGT